MVDGSACAGHLEFSPDGGRLAVFGMGSQDSITIWNPLTGERCATLRGRLDHANGRSWSDDARTLTFESPDQLAIEQWRTADG